MTVLALDIGGTKFAAAHVTPDGTLLSRAERPIGPDPTGTLRRLVTDFATSAVTAVGIGTAGPLDTTTGTVSPVNIPAWRDFPLVDTVRRLAGGKPVTLAGDAQCMAMGEWWRGDHGVPSLLGIVVSTGIGGGLVLRDAPWRGDTGNAGHIGHIPVDPCGEPCPCGARGCLETTSSGPSMVRWALARGWRPPTGEPTARDLADAALDGAAVPLAAFERSGRFLATAVRTATTLLDVRHVVIGGGVAAAGDLLLNPLRDHLGKHAGLPFTRDITVTLTTLARDAGLYGAAAFALPARGGT
ncbi:ROK family protein [Actinomadura kijaniata]|uniref:Glucokinase n=1 Tax=Actinomadura namibiensis TaxID=182080 RepID=A0A7W3LKS4_ACTNM|nr:ROK family protein [Actinomadura namibiensis]MBA8949953.1 glucokinase [Actinomadura namibiensis]